MAAPASTARTPEAPRQRRGNCEQHHLLARLKSPMRHQDACHITFRPEDISGLQCSRAGRPHRLEELRAHRVVGDFRGHGERKFLEVWPRLVPPSTPHIRHKVRCVGPARRPRSVPRWLGSACAPTARPRNPPGQSFRTPMARQARRAAPGTTSLSCATAARSVRPVRTAGIRFPLPVRAPPRQSVQGGRPLSTTRSMDAATRLADRWDHWARVPRAAHRDPHAAVRTTAGPGYGFRSTRGRDSR